MALTFETPSLLAKFTYLLCMCVLYQCIYMCVCVYMYVYTCVDIHFYYVYTYIYKKYLSKSGILTYLSCKRKMNGTIKY